MRMNSRVLFCCLLPWLSAPVESRPADGGAGKFYIVGRRPRTRKGVPAPKEE